MNNYILDGHKCIYHLDKIKDWLDGKRIAPITIDWALTQTCPYNCIYCYGKLQKNPGRRITKDIAFNFLNDAKEMGVKAISLVSDGESTTVPFFYDVVSKGKELGLDIAVGTCGYPLKKDKLPELLKNLTYLRFNVSAANPQRYAYIHGTTEKAFHTVYDIIEECVRLKRDNQFSVTIGLQMVLMPDFADQIIPMAKLGKELGVDYTIIKHCSDDENGNLGVDYNEYKKLYHLLEDAEKYTTKDYLVKVKWSKIKSGNIRSYNRCYAPPLFLQTSGSGLIAPCGMLFNPKYKRYWIGNITKGDRLIDLWKGDRYWEVMNHLASDKFDVNKECGCLCIQDRINNFLSELKNPPEHINFL